MCTWLLLEGVHKQFWTLPTSHTLIHSSLAPSSHSFITATLSKWSTQSPKEPVPVNDLGIRRGWDLAPLIASTFRAITSAGVFFSAHPQLKSTPMLVNSADYVSVRCASEWVNASSVAGHFTRSCRQINNSQVHMLSYIIIHNQITWLLHNESRVTLFLHWYIKSVCFVWPTLLKITYMHLVQETFIGFSTVSLTENLLSEAQECETNLDSHKDVPKLIISSSCIRLLDVVGQGTLTTI